MKYCYEWKHILYFFDSLNSLFTGIGAPFIRKQFHPDLAKIEGHNDVSCVIDLLREGRTALAEIFTVFMFTACYSLLGKKQNHCLICSCRRQRPTANNVFSECDEFCHTTHIQWSTVNKRPPNDHLNIYQVWRLSWCCSQCCTSSVR